LFTVERVGKLAGFTCNDEHRNWCRLIFLVTAVVLFSKYIIFGAAQLGIEGSMWYAWVGLVMDVVLAIFVIVMVVKSGNTFVVSH